MANAIQTPNGKWKCTVYLGKDDNGKQIRKCITADRKKDAEDRARAYQVANKKDYVICDKSMTVGEAIDRYVTMKEQEVKDGKCSPTTLSGYKSYQNNLIDDIKDVLVLKISDRILNDWISKLEKDHKPKSCKNAYSLVRASLMEVLPRSTVLDWRIKLPTISKKKVNVPTEANIMKLLEYLKGYDYDMYIAVLLASFGTMRRSEICALTADDVEGNTIHISKALVHDRDIDDWVLKSTKTDFSERDVIMPDFVIKALPKSGKLVGINPQRVTDRFVKYLKRLNMRTFRFHDLRHYSASIMHELGASNETIMARGGWSNDFTLTTHYRGSMDEYSAKFTEKLNKHFEDTFAV